MFSLRLFLALSLFITSAASAQDVCQAKVISELRAEYAKLFTSSGVSSVDTVYNIQVRGPSAAVTIARAIVGAQPVSAFFKGEMNCPRDSSGTRDVRCVFEIAYQSEEVALLSFVLAKKTGYFLSLDQSRMNGTWGSEQAWTLYNSLTQVPSQLIPPGYKPLRIYTDQTGIDCGGDPNHHACNELSTHGMMMRKNAVQPWIVIHMLAHDFDGLEGTIDGGGKEYKKAVSDRRKAGRHITGYAAQNLVEDFAEHFTAYVLEADRLSREFPETYAFFREQVFGSVQYLKQASWQSPPDGAFTPWQSLPRFMTPESFRRALAGCLLAVKSVNAEKGEVTFGPHGFVAEIRPNHSHAQFEPILNACLAAQVTQVRMNAREATGGASCGPGWASSIEYAVNYAAKAYLQEIFKIAAKDSYFRNASSRDRITGCLTGGDSSISCRPIAELF